ncbi:MAG: hydroxymethylglutaryl-CoA reductase, degradative [Chloroflexi bacterium]|nr:hydroxymethylglutaryl-CoA reductase, degradative [Chloroflexota bacterium]
MSPSSRISDFYKLSPADRQRIVVEWAELTNEQASALENALGLAQADKMIENAIGVYGLPFGIATNFVVNGRDVLAPMVVEEPSVVAGASYAARLARAGGGFHAETTASLMIGQIQVLDLDRPEQAAGKVLAQKQRLIDLANRTDPVIVSLHGGARDVEARPLLDSPVGPMLVVHVIYDCRDAMGANMVNTACEALAPVIEEITGGRVNLRILSNLADRRLARGWCVVPAKALTTGDLAGELVVERVVEAWALAAVDPYRAATHNKGIMNGIDAVAIATGNDWRAIEAGAHAYAARDGSYRSLSTWSVNQDGDLAGRLELPLAVGVVGGATRVHPAARVALQILGVATARDLAEIIVSVGLAQNLAALRALATEGIQRGHMALHARQVATAAGAVGDEVDRIAAALVAERTIRSDRAAALLRAARET